jgi:hypothetical protein
LPKITLPKLTLSKLSLPKLTPNKPQSHLCHPLTLYMFWAKMFRVKIIPIDTSQRKVICLT